jgi:uncharacterized caspase-like protein
MARYALVIGIGENQPPLKLLTKTVGDAKAITQILHNHGNFHVELLTQPKQVQSKALITAIQTFVQQRAAGDEALIYYTGHVTTIPRRAAQCTTRPQPSKLIVMPPDRKNINVPIIKLIDQPIILRNPFRP